MNNLLNIYTDYLISSTGPTTATGLSRLSGNQISHDKITRFLREAYLDSRGLWQHAKPYRAAALAELTNDACLVVYLRGIEKPVLLVKQVFTNKDGSQGSLYLVSSDTSLDFDATTTIYKKRSKVEEYHKSLKQNASLAKSSTKTILTQANHFFASIMAFVKLEKLKIKTGLGHFQFKAKLYFVALNAMSKQLTQFHA